jgi:hypothetical protein
VARPPGNIEITIACQLFAANGLALRFGFRRN